MAFIRPDGRVEVAGDIVVDRHRAVRFIANGRPSWLPKNKIKIERDRDGRVNVIMPKWLAENRGYV